MVDGDDGVARVQVRIVQHLPGIQHRPARHPRLGEGGHHLLLRARARPLARDRVELLHVFPARGRVHAARITQKIVAADGAGEVAPHALVHRLHVDVDVVVRPARRARVEAVGHRPGRGVVAPARGGLAVAVVGDIALARQVGHRLLHRHLDDLPPAGALPLDVRGHDARHHVHAGAAVPDVGAAQHGLAIGKARDAHHPARGLGDHVEALVLVIRPGEAEALEPGEDEARVGGAQGIPAQPEPLHEAGGEVLHHHVRALGHREKERATVGMLQVDGDAPLVRVEEEEEHRVEPRHLRPVAPGLLAADGLDLDDVRAEPSQELRARRARLELRQVQDANARQRALGHGSLSLFGTGSVNRAESYHAPRILVESRACGSKASPPFSSISAAGRTCSSSRSRRKAARTDGVSATPRPTATRASWPTWRPSPAISSDARPPTSPTSSTWRTTTSRPSAGPWISGAR